MIGDLRERPATPSGASLLHPIALLAVALLLLNDHVLKAVAPSWVTGKLSDVAGLLFFPLLLHAMWTLIRRGRSVDHRRTLLVAILATGSVFAAIKLWPEAGDAYRTTVGLLQWPFAVLGAAIAGAPVAAPAPVRLVQDASDLIALPILAMTYLVGIRTNRGTGSVSPSRPQRGPSAPAGPRRFGGAHAVVVLAALASVASSGAGPEVGASHERESFLGSDAPFVSRRFEVRLTRDALERANYVGASLERVNVGPVVDLVRRDLPVEVSLGVGPDGARPEGRDWHAFRHDLDFTPFPQDGSQVLPGAREWLPRRRELKFTLDDCDGHDCVLELWAHLRWTGGPQEPIVVPWRFSFVYGVGGAPDAIVDVSADPSSEPAPLGAVALAGGAAGAAFPLFAFAVVSVARRRPWHTAVGHFVRVVVGATQLALALGLAVAAFLLAQHVAETPFWPDPNDAVTYLVVLAGTLVVATVRWFSTRSSSLVVPDLVILVSFSVLTIWASRAGPAYRPIDLAVVMALASGLATLGLGAALHDSRARWSGSSLSNRHLAVALATAAVLAAHGLATALDVNGSEVRIVAVTTVGAALLAAGVVQSLEGSPRLLATVSVVIALGAGLVAVALLLFSSFLGADPLEILAAAFVAIGATAVARGQLPGRQPSARVSPEPRAADVSVSSGPVRALSARAGSRRFVRRTRHRPRVRRRR